MALIYYKLVNNDLPEYFNHIPCIHNFEIINTTHEEKMCVFPESDNHKYVKKYIWRNIIVTVNNDPSISIDKKCIHILYYGSTTYIKNCIIKNCEQQCLIPNRYICKN